MVWVCRGSRFGFAAVGYGDHRLLFIFIFIFILFFIFGGVDGWRRVMFFRFSMVVVGWLVRWYRFVVSGGVVDGFVVLGLWLVVFIDCGHGFATIGLGFTCYGLGFWSQ